MTYDEIYAAWQADADVATALARLDRLLAQEPDHCDALNLAGWLRTAHVAGDGPFERGLSQLRRAMAAGAAIAPVVNFAQALAGKGRGREAVDEVRSWCEAHRHEGAGWNVLGWLLGVSLADNAAGLEALAKGRERGNRDAELNTARLLSLGGSEDEMLRCLEVAVLAPGCWRRHEAWFRLAALHSRRGHLRRTLGAARRAVEWDDGEYQTQIGPLVQSAGTMLLQQGKYCLNVREDRLLALESESGYAAGESIASLSTLSAEAEQLAPSLAGAARAACRAIADMAGQAQLLHAYADQSPSAILLEAAGNDARLYTLAMQWQDAQLMLYKELLAREEGPDADTVRTSTNIALLIDLRLWERADRAIEALNNSPQDRNPEAQAFWCELLGDRLSLVGLFAQAQDAYRSAENGAREHASYSTSGGEGLSRMVAVERLVRKQAAAHSATR